MSLDQAVSRAEPLTLGGYISAALAQRGESPEWRPVHVQIRKQGATFCGTVRDARESDAGKPFFLVDADYLGQVWCAGSQVRLCSGDGFCVCEAPR